MTKEQRTYGRERIASAINGVVKTGQPHAKILFHIIYKIYSKWIKNLNVSESSEREYIYFLLVRKKRNLLMTHCPLDTTFST